MPTEVTPDRSVDRRLLLRGGAVLAGAAGVAVAGAALAPTAAQAADGSALTIGAANTASTATRLTIATGANPALDLTNADGPVLEMEALDFQWNGPLTLGQLANTAGGPRIGVDYGAGTESTYLATGIDLESSPAPYAFTPERYMDTRDADYRSSIIGASSSAPFDSKGQLKAKSWIDIGISAATEDNAVISAVFLNLTAVRPATGGFLSVYPSGFPVPSTSNVNFQTNVTIANAAFVAVGVVSGFYAIRVYAAKASHVIVDLTGAVFGGDPADPNEVAAKGVRAGKQARRLHRMRRAAKR